MDIEKELEKFKSMLDKGLISEEDYESKKNELLSAPSNTSIPNTTSDTKSVIGKNPRRKKIVALIIVFTPFGGLGFHRFYTGHYNTGLLMFCTFGVFGFMWFMDIFRLLSDNFQDADGNSLI